MELFCVYIQMYRMDLFLQVHVVTDIDKFTVDKYLTLFFNC